MPSFCQTLAHIIRAKKNLVKLQTLPNCPSLQSIPFRQLHTSPLPTLRFVHVYTAVSMAEESWHHPCVCVCDDCSHPALGARVHGRPRYDPNMCVVPQGHFGWLTGPFWNPLALQLFISLRWHLLWSFFYFSLRSASQQAASNCYIFSWQEETAHITSRDVA